MSSNESIGNFRLSATQQKGQKKATVERERGTFARQWCQRTWTLLGSAGCDASWMRRICEFPDRNAGRTARATRDGIVLRDKKRRERDKGKGREERKKGERERERERESSKVLRLANKLMGAPIHTSGRQNTEPPPTRRPSGYTKFQLQIGVSGKRVD
jgi:hypothetical protein